MPKYIRKRPGPKPKPHKVIQGIEYKQCSSCNEWKLLNQFGKKGNGKQTYCRDCKKKRDTQYNKQRRKVILEMRKQARDVAPTSFLVCLYVCCTVKQWLQPLDQFIHPHVRNDTYTRHCLTCRNKEKEANKRRRTACQKVWDEYRKTHPCVKCMNDPNYEHNYLLIEADHLPEFEKVEKCSEMSYWSAKCRGPAKLRAELKKCQATCRFHHRLQTQQRDHDNRRIQKQSSILRKRAIINAEKHKRGCCLRCKRHVKEGEECGFSFDHRDPTTKFIRKGKPVHPASFVKLPDALFDTQWPLEQAKCDLLCANCHGSKTNVSRDGYRK